jgi:N-methylhydantoinase B/oxoprolinase/acetone carboxylase alpha subunit
VQIRGTEEIVEIVLAGGAGYGEPRERDRALVAQDVQRGLVTAEGAARDYGVELDPAPHPALVGPGRADMLNA